MYKRGQLTILIILGLVILVIIGIILYFTTNIFTPTTSESIAYPSEIQEIVDWNQECLSELGLSSIKDISRNGGHYESGETYSLVYEGEIVPYAYYSGFNILPTIAQIEQSLELHYFERIKETCIDLNPYFSQLTLLDQSVNIIVENESIDFEIELPIIVSAQEAEFNLPSEYTFTHPIRLGYIHTTSNNIIDQSVADPNFFDFDTMLGHGIDIEIQRLTNESYVFEITDPQSLINQQPLLFRFGGYYPQENITDPEFSNLLSEVFGI